MRTLRCSICNCTNDPNVSDTTSVFIGVTGKKFYRDPHKEDEFICFSCKSVVDDIMYDYQIMDLIREIDSEDEYDIEGILKESKISVAEGFYSSDGELYQTDP